MFYSRSSTFVDSILLFFCCQSMGIESINIMRAVRVANLSIFRNTVNQMVEEKLFVLGECMVLVVALRPGLVHNKSYPNNGFGHPNRWAYFRKNILGIICKIHKTLLVLLLNYFFVRFFFYHIS